MAAIQTTPQNKDWELVTRQYPISLKDYEVNFNSHFDDHYAKIDQYKKNLLSHLKLSENAVTFIVGFWAENLFPPLYDDNRKYAGELYYFFTKQFCDKIAKSTDLGFMLFGSYYMGKRQLFYYDKDTLVPKSYQIDLHDSKIALSHLNNNEVSAFSSF